MSSRVASLSIDLDNKWSYLKTHGDPAWRSYPSFLDTVIPRVLGFLADVDVRATFFVVGHDATRDESREVLADLGVSGHEIGNHSYWHEPWLHRYTEQEVRAELGRAHECIVEATGHRPVGFRGPGYSLSAAVLRALSDLGYRYDASTLPTGIGPLARAYYFRTSQFTAAEREERAALFGSWRDAFRPLRPYRWGVEGGALVEIPVTTAPLVRLPIHFSYLLYLSALSSQLSWRYLDVALWLCQRRGITPSMVVHPLEFIDTRDAGCDGLEFMPWITQPHQRKLELLHEYVAVLQKRFAVGGVLAHVDAAEAADADLRTRRPSLATSGQVGG